MILVLIFKCPTTSRNSYNIEWMVNQSCTYELSYQIKCLKNSGSEFAR